MLVAVIPVKNIRSAYRYIKAVQDRVDAYELRLDYWAQMDLKRLARLRQSLTLPVIFTLRSKQQGGHYCGSLSHYCRDLDRLCQLKPDYLDLELHIPIQQVQILKSKYPTIQLIRSYHHMKKTSVDLPSLLHTMQDSAISLYKIAIMCHHTIDALHMLMFIQNRRHDRLIGLCMGELGQCTRILGKIFGNAMTFAAVDEKTITAPGQLTVDELLSRYHYRALHQHTSIFALFGFPVHDSVGHILHNEAINRLKTSAIYVKLEVTAQDLPDVFLLCRQLHFSGFSITMPLKSAILPLLDEVLGSASVMRVVNSVMRIEHRYKGWNTDGAAVINVLSRRGDVAKQCIAILGAGNTACAIAYHARQVGAQVVVMNRTFSKAQALEDFGCKAVKTLSGIPYTVLINTIPEIAFQVDPLKTWLDQISILEGTMILDVVYQPITTLFLKATQSVKAAVLIPGYEVYIEQALMQLDQWFHPSVLQRAKIQHDMLQYFNMNFIEPQ